MNIHLRHMDQNFLILSYENAYHVSSRVRFWLNKAPICDRGALTTAGKLHYQRISRAVQDSGPIEMELLKVSFERIKKKNFLDKSFEYLRISQIICMVSTVCSRRDYIHLDRAYAMLLGNFRGMLYCNLPEFIDCLNSQGNLY